MQPTILPKTPVELIAYAIVSKVLNSNENATDEELRKFVTTTFNPLYNSDFLGFDTWSDKLVSSAVELARKLKKDKHFVYTPTST